jgi:hypothetical protein
VIHSTVLVMAILYLSDAFLKPLSITIFLNEPLKGKMVYVFHEKVYKGLHSIKTQRSMNRQNGESHSNQYIILWHELAKGCKFCIWRNHDLHLSLMVSIVNIAKCQISLTNSIFKHNTQDLRCCSNLSLSNLTHYRWRKYTFAVLRTWKIRFQYFCCYYANDKFH